MDSLREPLERKILEMYPEIRKHGITLDFGYDGTRNAWIIMFQKGDFKRYVFLDRKDADSCIEGRQCVYLGFLINQYLSDLEKDLEMSRPA